MDTGILTDVKGLLGIQETDTTFDNQLLVHINTAFSILMQRGFVAKSATKDISITNMTSWDELGIIEGGQMIKNYIYFKVKLWFDPPLSSAAAQSMESMATELEWRIATLYETYKEEEPVV